MNKKISLALLFGGRSCEHQVSVVSARSVLDAIDLDRYQTTLIGISLSGKWLLSPDGHLNSLIDDGFVSETAGIPVVLDLNQPGRILALDSDSAELPFIDVVMPILHGTYGEDGTVQGLLEMIGLPYVGCGVLASSAGMDKVISNQLFDAAAIPQANYLSFHRVDWHSQKKSLLANVAEKLGYPVFIKPANMGSSVGISKAQSQVDLIAGVEEALLFDHKILIEASCENCHEIECAVLGNDEPAASLIGEIDSGADFYDYESKYVSDTSTIIIPAHLPEDVSNKVRAYAVDAFRAVEGSGLARVDFFVDRLTHQIYINEINTMPGFTPISMYPKMWQQTGLPYPGLIDKLVSLAFEKHEQKSRLKLDYSDRV